jgi:phosphotransferase system enzyme I (PtsP)
MAWFPNAVQIPQRFFSSKSSSFEDVKRIFLKLKRQFLSEKKALGKAGNFLDFPLAVLDDPELISEIQGLAKRGFDWPKAISKAFEKWEKKLKHASDAYLRLRAHDLSDLRKKILSLLENPKKEILPQEPFVALAHDFSVTNLLEWKKAPLQAIVLEKGNEASHGVLLARALGIPVVGGVKGILKTAQPGDFIQIQKKAIFVHPQKVELQNVEIKNTTEKEEIIPPLRTKDGNIIFLRANVQFPEEVEKAKRLGAHGIGLFRTEFLHLTHPLSLKEETEIYRTAIQSFEPHPVVFRLADFGSDKPFPKAKRFEEKNPALGWRGMQFLLDQPKFLRHQLKALCAAAGKEILHLLLPMVRSLNEIKEFFTLFAPIQKEYGTRVRVGIMVETPSSVFFLEKLPPSIKFISLGTNDLLQYFFAVDRLHPKIKANPLDPLFLEYLRTMIQKAKELGKSISLCGEIAGNPKAIPLLLSMGLFEFSVSVSKIQETAKALQNALL